MGWKIRESLNAARSHPAVVTVDEKIYAIGGGGADFKSLSSVECYDPSENSWNFVKDMPTKRSGMMAIALGGRIYVIGGGYKKPDGKFCFLPTVEIYDLESGIWESGPDMLQPHDYPAVVLLGDEVYIMAGHHPDATEGGPKTDPGSRFCEKWKIGSDAWEEIAPMSVPRFGPSAEVAGSEIWVMGGVALSDAGFNNYDIIEIYNPSRGSWRQDEGVNLPWPAAAFGTGRHGNRLYAMGGYSGNMIHDRVSVCEPEGGVSWTDLEPMPERKAAMGTVICGGEIYCVGGWAEDGRTPVNFVSSLPV